MSEVTERRVHASLQLSSEQFIGDVWIAAVPVSAHPSPLVITTKLAAAILVVAVVWRRGSTGPVLPL